MNDADKIKLADLVLDGYQVVGRDAFSVQLRYGDDHIVVVMDMDAVEEYERNRRTDAQIALAKQLGLI